MAVRRVVTGTTSEGRSFVATDATVSPITVAALPGYAWHKLFALPAGTDHFPPPGAVRFHLYTVPPDSVRRPQLTPEALRELEDRLPGRAAQMGDDQAGMHRTASVDFAVVLSGRISLELDDATVELRTGDCLVQNGTSHAWRNRTGEPCTLAIVMVGVHPA